MMTGESGLLTPATPRFWGTICCQTTGAPPVKPTCRTRCFEPQQDLLPARRRTRSKSSGQASSCTSSTAAIDKAAKCRTRRAALLQRALQILAALLQLLLELVNVPGQFFQFFHRHVRGLVCLAVSLAD